MDYFSITTSNLQPDLKRVSWFTLLEMKRTGLILKISFSCGKRFREWKHLNLPGGKRKQTWRDETGAARATALRRTGWQVIRRVSQEHIMAKIWTVATTTFLSPGNGLRSKLNNQALGVSYWEVSNILEIGIRAERVDYISISRQPRLDSFIGVLHTYIGLRGDRKNETFHLENSIFVAYLCQPWRLPINFRIEQGHPKRVGTEI